MNIYKALWQNALMYILYFIILLITGTIGYVIIEDYSALEALFMTTITLSTVGYSETKPLHDAGRIFTIFLILGNFGILTYVIAKVSQFLFDGEFRILYKRLSMENKIAHLSDHVIVCGCGQNGFEAIKELRKSNLQYVVIDKDEPVASKEIEFLIHDDATKDEALLHAGIKRAKAILITLPSDAENMFVVLTAKELNPSITIISRASKDSSVKKLKAAGASNVIMPDKLGGVHMANLVLFPDVKEFIDVMSTYGNDENNIQELIPTKTQTLEQLNAWQNSGATVLGVREKGGEYIINPPKDFLISPEIRVIVLATSDQADVLRKLI